MTLYFLLALSWLFVGLALLVLWLARERSPETQWHLMLAATVAPFVLAPMATLCQAALEQARMHLPLLDSFWPLAGLTGAGAVVAVARAVVVLRRERRLLVLAERPDGAVACLLGRYVAELSRAAGLPRPPRIVVYPRGASVCVLGSRHPTIVISRALLTVLSEPELRGVLAHEIAHVRRRDYILNWLGIVLRSALFYLPPWSVGWGAFAEIRERRADRLAAGYTADPLALAAALIKVWRHAPPGAATAAASMLARERCLEDRIRRLIDPPPPDRRMRRGALIIGVLVGGLLLARTTVEGGTHLLVRVSPAMAEWEACCDPQISPVPHCVTRPRVFCRSLLPTVVDRRSERERPRYSWRLTEAPVERPAQPRCGACLGERFVPVLTMHRSQFRADMTIEDFARNPNVFNDEPVR